MTAPLPFFTGANDAGALRDYLNQLVNALNSPGSAIGQLLALGWGVLPSSSGASPLTPGTNYVPGDTITLTGGVFNRAALIGVGTTQVVSATVMAGGSGGSDGTRTVTGTTGTGTKFQASVTVLGGAITQVLGITVAGAYTVNPTNLSAEPVTGASLTGAQLSIVMGVLLYTVDDYGSYIVFPTNPVAQGSTSGSGTGATFNVSYGPIAAAIDNPTLAAGGNVFIGGSASTNSLAGGLNAGGENTYVGYGAGGRIGVGSFNSAFGHNALGIGNGNTATTGSNNCAFGTDALRNFAGGTGHTAIGTSALKNYVSGAGQSCTAVGSSAMLNWSSGNGSPNNTAVGALALQGTLSTSTFLRCTAIGVSAGQADTTGSDNCFFGSTAGNKVTQGSRNVIIGSAVATTTLTTGNDNVLIGTNSSIDTAASGTGNSIAIGAGSTAIFSASGCGTPATSLASVAGNLGIGKVGISSAVLALIAGTTALAQINMPSSTAPTSPNDGDFWYDGTNLKFRHGATTQTITWT